MMRLATTVSRRSLVTAPRLCALEGTKVSHENKQPQRPSPHPTTHIPLVSSSFFFLVRSSSPWWVCIVCICPRFCFCVLWLILCGCLIIGWNHFRRSSPFSLRLFFDGSRLVLPFPFSVSVSVSPSPSLSYFVTHVLSLYSPLFIGLSFHMRNCTTLSNTFRLLSFLSGLRARLLTGFPPCTVGF